MTPKKLQSKSRYESLDLDQDGIVSDDELEKADRILEMEITEEKSDSQRRMAWVCLLSVVVLTVLLISPAVAETRVDALSDLVGLFYISMAGVIGAHMGVQAWMSRR
tara:strand:- start:299 stop:619 length:321 start_codon:yes stop_codon:yes gene_type:complete